MENKKGYSWKAVDKNPRKEGEYPEGYQGDIKAK